MEAEEDAEWERDALDERPGGNCVKIGLPRKSILRYYFQENRTSQRPFQSGLCISSTFWELSSFQSRIFITKKFLFYELSSILRGTVTTLPFLLLRISFQGRPNFYTIGPCCRALSRQRPRRYRGGGPRDVRQGAAAGEGRGAAAGRGSVDPGQLGVGRRRRGRTGRRRGGRRADGVLARLPRPHVRRPVGHVAARAVESRVGLGEAEHFRGFGVRRAAGRGPYGRQTGERLYHGVTTGYKTIGKLFRS